MTNARLDDSETAAELRELRRKILAQPLEIRTELEPLIEEALEHARFRDRILSVAKDALSRYRLDLELVKFDLEATRRELESSRKHGKPAVDRA